MFIALVCSAKGRGIMRDEDTITRNLKVKQGAFFISCESEGLTMGVLAATSGIPIDTLRSYRPTRSREASVMGLTVYVKLLRALPSNLLHLGSLLIEDSGCVVASADTQAANWLAIGERACAFGAKVFRYQASDNHIDHREDADLREELLTIVSEGHGVLGG